MTAVVDDPLESYVWRKMQIRICGRFATRFLRTNEPGRGTGVHYARLTRALPHVTNIEGRDAIRDTIYKEWLFRVFKVAYNTS